MIEPRILEVRTKILKKNDELARAMREEFQRLGVLVVNFVSSPGTGKTALLQETMRRLVEAKISVAAVVGDLETDNDAKRLAQSGAPVRQIMTHGMCHLEADMVQQHIADWNVGELEFLFIENVGNLVCPSSWDLGESIRVALLSVTEGEDKPLKYPNLFNTSDIAVITKMDLADVCEFDRQTALDNLFAVRPGIHVIETSAKKGTGITEWIDYLQQMRARLISE
ncbi:MAG TPA: hydrogenase nickel incorporation protein HypB [Pirellulaceae bacterium]|nr:hydrogenase nickel incorporation protein HypB [Pirellulaceae bacterium]HMO90683.1 hydrogenase nickel incorporation protein HypB [Pirellulaceae bacterium]HMP67738.1 hydrogenase nickel incorporation protein HypB [Pirellulaceae bacterium]